MKIGRNDKCPCGSGRKYKQCCATKPQKAMKPMENREKVTLRAEIATVQALAEKKIAVVQELGVFILYADTVGDAWLFEITESDCVRIASAGSRVEVPLEENDDTIIVDWSHRYAFTNKQVFVTAYGSKESTLLANAPSHQLFAAEKRILRKYSPQLLEQVHIKK